MTKKEKLLVSAYSGVLLCDLPLFLAYAGEILGHEVAIEDWFLIAYPEDEDTNCDLSDLI